MEDRLGNFNVNSRSSFAEFVELLSNDYRANPEKWEHVKIESFLEAISRYARDIQGYYDNTGQNTDANVPAWKTFADILRGGLIYE